MMFQKTHILVTCLFLTIFTVQLFSQDDLEDPDFLDIPYDTSMAINDVPNLKKKSKVNHTVNIGTNFSYLSNNLFTSSYYVNPSLNYDATKRLNLTVGTGFAYSNIMSFAPDDESKMLPMTTMYLYTQGIYKVSEKLVVGGSVEYAQNDVPNLKKKDENNSPVQRDITSYSVGLTYQLRPNITISVNFEQSNDPYRYRYNPLYHHSPNYPYFSPFGVGY